jgi:hypothetical protein
MEYKYHVFHDYVAARQSAGGLSSLFDEVQEEPEYSCFPGTLAHRRDVP